MAKDPYIDPKRTWVTADSHFGHQNIVGFCHRPTDHEQIIMEEWAKAVPADGTVLHLGDLSYRNNGMFRHVISRHLTGERKFLVKGNHDSQRPIFYRDAGFTLVRPFEIYYDPSPDRPGRLSKRWIVSFSHYPLKDPNGRGQPDGKHRKRVHIHGHIHNNGYGGKDAPYIPFSAGQINVSVEQTHYRPVNLDDLLRGYILGAYESPRVQDTGVEPVRAGLQPAALPS